MGWDQTLIKIDEKGARFRSYVDGSIHHLTPERSIDIQRQLGADLIVGQYDIINAAIKCKIKICKIKCTS